MKKLLKKNGTISLVVHGKYNVPYFDCILEPVKKMIPDYLPKYPEMDRFGTKETFENAIKKSGFSKIVVKKFVFQYSPGTFSDYWTEPSILFCLKFCQNLGFLGIFQWTDMDL